MPWKEHGKKETHEVTFNEEVPLTLRHIKLHGSNMSQREVPNVAEHWENGRRDTILLPSAVDGLIDLFDRRIQGGKGGDLLIRRAIDHPEKQAG